MSAFDKFIKLKSNKSVMEQSDLFKFNFMSEQKASSVNQRIASVPIDKSSIDADIKLRAKSGEVWRNASEEEKDAIYRYTTDYGHFNMPLRGYDRDTGEFKGAGKVNISQMTKYDIDDMTNMISKSSYDFDMTVRRGYNFTNDKMDKFFGVSTKSLQSAPEELLRGMLKDKEIVDHGFVSTSAVEHGGFQDFPVIMDIHVPKRSQAMYVEPFSELGNGARRNWDGISTQDSFSNEMEVILQRDSSFMINNVKREDGKLLIDMSLTRQNPRKI